MLHLEDREQILVPLDDHARTQLCCWNHSKGNFQYKQIGAPPPTRVSCLQSVYETLLMLLLLLASLAWGTNAGGGPKKEGLYPGPNGIFWSFKAIKDPLRFQPLRRSTL